MIVIPKHILPPHLEGAKPLRPSDKFRSGDIFFHPILGSVVFTPKNFIKMGKWDVADYVMDRVNPSPLDNKFYPEFWIYRHPIGHGMGLAQVEVAPLP